jgi:protein-tyrosine phosphatase
MHTVLFVCLGNICRSPAAEAIMLHMIKGTELESQVYVASCGLGDWHEGKLPDPRMREVALDRGYTLVSRAQGVKPEFFYQFDYILAADHSIINELYSHAASPEHKAKIHLITKFSRAFPGEEIPDPFYLDRQAFEQVIDMLEDSCKGLIEDIRKRIHG